MASVVVRRREAHLSLVMVQGSRRGLKRSNYKGRCLFRVYISNKPAKYGIKVRDLLIYREAELDKANVVYKKVKASKIDFTTAMAFAMVKSYDITRKMSAPSTLDISAKSVGNINVSAACSCTYLNIVSVNNVFCAVDELIAESLFRTTCVKLMTLDTAVTQLDFYDGYLLVSTITKSYICNTQLETFAQVGNKGRQGEYGGCFCPVKVSGNDVTSVMEHSQGSGAGSLTESFEEATHILEQSFKNSGRLGTLECDEAEEAVEADEVEVTEQTELRAFCARPGTRLWEVDNRGNVLITHQLKNSLSTVLPTQVLHIDTPDNGLPTNRHKTFDERYQSLQGSVAFSKVVQFHKGYLAAASSCGLFIIDPSRSQVVMWIEVSDGVLDLVVSGNMVMYHTGKGAVHTLIITRLDVLILMLHSNALYKKCSNLCLNNSSIFRISKLLSGMSGRILSDLIANCDDNETNVKLEELMKKCADSEEGKSQSIVGPITFKDLFISDKSVKGSGEEVDDGYDLGNHIFLPFFGTRWMNEPKMLSSYKGNQEQVDHKTPSGDVHIVSLESSTSSSNTNNSNSNGDSVSNSNHSATSPQKSSQSNSRHSRGSFESSQEMYEDPLFPEDDSEYDSEGVSRAMVERKRLTLKNSRLSSFYYPYAAPQGSETAAALQDIVENVASNVVDGITAGTKSLTEKLKNVTISPIKKTQVPSRSNMNAPPLLSEAIFDQKFSPLSEKRRDSFNEEIIIRPNKFKKKGSNSINNSPALSRKPFTTDLINQEIDSYYQPSSAIGLVRNLHELVSTTMAQVIGNKNENETYLHLKNWLQTFCNTLLQIQENCGSEFIMQLTYEDLCTDGSMSVVSDISYSLVSQPTSLDSLNWDSTDLGLDLPNINSSDIVNQVTHLFFRCMSAGVTTNNCPVNFESSGCYGSKKAPQLLQSIHTPEIIKEIDIYYSQIIASDCGLLNYSYLMDSLETLGHSYYFHIWASLVHKLAKTSLDMKNAPLPDVVADLDFSRSQRVTFLYEIAMRDVKSFISAAAKVEGALMLFDFIYFLTLIEDKNEKGAQEIRINYLHLQQYLCQISMTKDVHRMYLDAWSRCPELQFDILAAILDSPRQSNYLCECGMPKPGKRKYPMENLLETIVSHEVLIPSKMIEFFLSHGCWSAFVRLNIKYNLQPIHACFPYILQSCDMLLLKSLITTFDVENFTQLASVLADLSTSDHSVLKCHRCETLIPITSKDKTHQLSNKSVDIEVLTNSIDLKNINYESESAIEKSSTESYEEDFKSLNLNTNRCFSENGNEMRNRWIKKDGNVCNEYLNAVSSVGDLWEVVVGHMVRELGSRETLKILYSVQDNIPSGVLPRKVFMWCILSSMVEEPGPQSGPDVRKTLMNNILSISPSPLSMHVEKDLSTLVAKDEQQDCSMNIDEVDTPSQWSLSGVKDDGHHWGVHANVASGVCEGCHLALTTPALVTEGGITVFPCSHAYHAICLINTGRNCVLCTNMA
ncbi:unnamed protein product, partial [Meganyctiphanes norvegica]